jgi:DmsE family decaheme c-type cytochrome
MRMRDRRELRRTERRRKSERRRKRLRSIAWGAGALAAGAVAAAFLGIGPVGAAESQGGVTVLQESGGAYAEGGASTCIQCHDQPAVLAILKTPHAMKGDKRTPFAHHECETCHGPGAKHVDEQSPIPVRFGPDQPAASQNAVCLGCHQGGNRIHWSGSTHQIHDVACTNCHTIHTEEQKVLKKDVNPVSLFKDNQTQVCFGCHPQIRAQILRVSSHPIQEGRVACTDCHNPHGSTTDHLLREETTNETCYRCHAEKRGPFLWEHEPAREDCTNCHTPHGSVHAYLLKARTPWLCQSCHDAQFHPGTAYSGTGLPGASPAQALLLKNCLNCHYEVHGSNHPSGVRFTR